MRPISALPLPDDSLTPGLTPESLAALSDAEVADQITTWGGRIAAGEARLLAYVGEFDERRAWAVTGVLSCAHWLSWRLGMGVKAASDRVRVARALRALPKTAAAFASGRLSFTQVRAITRIATETDEALFVSISRHASGGQIERLAGGIRRARKLAARREAAKAGDQTRAQQRPTVSTRYDADGDLIISLKVCAADGAVVLAALEAGCSDLDSLTEAAAESSAEDSGTSKASRGQGWMRLCESYLDVRTKVRPGQARRDRSKLTVQVDPRSGWARLPDGELLAPAVAAASGLTLPAGTALRRLCLADLTRHDAGRSRRAPSQALRDLLTAVDGARCRFPSCTRHRRLHAHHLKRWAKGGRTDLANLIWLCGRHHTIAHAEDFQFALDPKTRVLTVTAKDGVMIPNRPTLPREPAFDLDLLGTVLPETLPPLVLDKLDLHYAVSVLLAA